jgi:hypothetical protein
MVYLRAFSRAGHPEYTNLPEGKFSDMKQHLRCHQGLKKDSKLLFMEDYFAKYPS